MSRSHQGTIHKRQVDELCSSNGIRGGLQLFKISSRGFLLWRWWTLHIFCTSYESIAQTCCLHPRAFRGASILLSTSYIFCSYLTLERCLKALSSCLPIHSAKELIASCSAEKRPRLLPHFHNRVSWSLWKVVTHDAPILKVCHGRSDFCQLQAPAILHIPYTSHSVSRRPSLNKMNFEAHQV